MIGLIVDLRFELLQCLGSVLLGSEVFDAINFCVVLRHLPQDLPFLRFLSLLHLRQNLLLVLFPSSFLKNSSNRNEKEPRFYIWIYCFPMFPLTSLSAATWASWCFRCVCRSVRCCFAAIVRDSLSSRRSCSYLCLSCMRCSISHLETSTLSQRKGLMSINSAVRWGGGGSFTTTTRIMTSVVSGTLDSDNSLASEFRFISSWKAAPPSDCDHALTLWLPLLPSVAAELRTVLLPWISQTQSDSKSGLDVDLSQLRFFSFLLRVSRSSFLVALVSGASWKSERSNRTTQPLNFSTFWRNFFSFTKQTISVHVPEIISRIWVPHTSADVDVDIKTAPWGTFVFGWLGAASYRVPLDLGPFVSQRKISHTISDTGLFSSHVVTFVPIYKVAHCGWPWKKQWQQLT